MHINKSANDKNITHTSLTVSQHSPRRRLRLLTGSSSCRRELNAARLLFNALEFRGNYSATSNNMKLAVWYTGRWWVGCYIWTGGPQPAQAPPRCAKCNSPPINGQCTNNRISVLWSVALRFNSSPQRVNIRPATENVHSAGIQTDNESNKKLSCGRETARCFTALNISLRHSRSL